MPIRNPFRKAGATTLESYQDENNKPTSYNGRDSGFEETEVAGAKPSSALDIRNNKDESNEYKLSGESPVPASASLRSKLKYGYEKYGEVNTMLFVHIVVNDSGVYLPPSPPEKKSFWRRSNNSSAASSNHRSMLSENEPFSISRESFDSYRRSFDISARSPVIQPEANPPRQSLDSRNARVPRSAVNAGRFERPQPTAEEGFEDVGLNDEAKPKKRGIFSRFGDSSDSPASADSRPSSSHHGFHLTGRKRGQSGQGAELGNMNTSASGAGDGIIR
ncbi:MAG: hypothetical protein M1827_006399 [Pycnora praestabilis]|nr:MAG: hypothetical protein M1827_006399 [Pycnora praestabilis]